MITKKNILDLEARRKIYEFIEENPGLTVNEISKRMKIPFTTLRYHIRALEKQELIKIRKKGICKFIYTKYEIGAQDKEIIELLRKKIPCRILLYFFLSPVCSQTELSKELDSDPSTVFYHLKNLMKKGIIEEAPMENGITYPYPSPKVPRFMNKTPRGREIFYRCKNQQMFMAIGRIMTAHKNSLADPQHIEEFLSFLKSLYSDWELNREYILKNAEKKVIEKNGKKVIHFKKPSEEEFYDIFYEIFRPPFCA
jgi:DNA-binding MarR family transcriptional regulator